MHLNDCFSDESSSEECPERDQEVAAGDSGKIEKGIRNLEKKYAMSRFKTFESRLIVEIQSTLYVKRLVVQSLQRSIIGWMPNSLVFKCHFNTPQPDQLNTVPINPILFTYVLVQYSNGQSGTSDINRPFEYLTI